MQSARRATMTLRVNLPWTRPEMSQRIFVVEDDPFLKEAVSLILTHAHFDVTTTAVGRGAVDLIRRARPHLVLLDIHLPDINGLTVLRSLRSAGLSMAVVMMTADNRPETVREVLASGGNGYLLKPFEPQDLVARVRRALEGLSTP